MDFNQILPALAPLAPLVVGPLASLLTQAAKNAPAIPFAGNTRTALVLALGLVAMLCNLGIAALNGTLATFDYSALIDLTASTVTAVLVAAGGYSLLKKGG